MDCSNCDKPTGDYKTDKSICGSCREVLKIDIVRRIRGDERIYLSESNRNKNGRKKKLTATDRNEIYWAIKRDGRTMQSLADEYSVSKGTVFNAIHSYT
jgi:hypothetical protein